MVGRMGANASAIAALASSISTGESDWCGLGEVVAAGACSLVKGVDVCFYVALDEPPPPAIIQVNETANKKESGNENEGKETEKEQEVWLGCTDVARALQLVAVACVDERGWARGKVGFDGRGGKGFIGVM